VGEREYLKDMAKVKDQFEYIEQRHRQQMGLLESRLTKAPVNEVKP
jgi:hypothetical protein